jgi:8-oxo-dGTP diphosphatase
MSTNERNKFHAAVYITFIHDGKILLLKRANTGYKDGLYGLPSGHIDGNEPAVVAAIREAEEEVGVKLKSNQLDLIHTMHRQNDKDDKYGYEYLDLYFRATNWDGELRNNEPQKCSEIKWVELTKLPDNIIPEVKHALQMIAVNAAYSDFNF